MSATIAGRGMRRRAFLQSGVAASFSGLAGQAWAASPHLDPVNPNIRFGLTSAIWDDEIRVNGKDIADDLAMVAAMGLQGVEPYRKDVIKYVDTPAHFLELKAKFTAAGIALIDCANGGPGQSTVFMDADKVKQTIAEHVAFARDYLAPAKCNFWKINMGPRPEGGPNDEQIKRLADALNEIGRQSIAVGVRLAPHPHIWGPMEREHDVRRVMELTDPRYVWLTTDTAHLTLGGMDAVQIISDYFPRVAEVHMKDCDPKYRGNKVTPTPAQHRQASVYHNLGAGGVDFPAIFKILRDRNFKGWVALDLDPPRPGDGTGGIRDNIATNIAYLRDTLHVKFPPSKT